MPRLPWTTWNWIRILQSRTTDAAALVLPAATYAESTGTLISSEGRAQRFFSVMPPVQPVAAAWRWVERIAVAAGIKARAWQSVDNVLDHIDRAVRLPENRFKLLEKGLILEYDLFGREGYYPLKQRHIDLPTDHQRLNEIIEIIKAGYIKQVLISQDIWNKHQRKKYGGWGYDHILRNTLPVMRANGMTEEQIRTLLVDNPRRVYTFA